MTPQELLDHSRDLYEKGEFGEAASGLVEVMRLVKDVPQPSLLHLAGMAFGQSRKHRDAFMFFTRAIELEPENGDYYGSRARALWACDAYGAAIDDIEKAGELSPALRDRLSSLEQKIRKDAAEPRYSVATDMSEFNAALGIKEKPLICPSCFASFPESEHLEADGACKCPDCGYRIPLDLLKKQSILAKPQRNADAESAVTLDDAKRLGYCWDCCKPEPSGAYAQDGSGRRRCRACCSRLGPLLDQ